MVVFVAVHGILRGVIEEGEEAEIIVVGDGIVFMGVTAGAGHRHAKQDGSQRFRSVEVVLRLELFGNRSAFRSGRVHADESGGDLLRDRWIREKITGDLPSDKIVERKVVVEGAHDPVAIWIDSTAIVEMETMGVAP